VPGRAKDNCALNTRVRRQSLGVIVSVGVQASMDVFVVSVFPTWYPKKGARALCQDEPKTSVHTTREFAGKVWE